MAQAKLKVILLRATPDPDELVALGARLCYAKADLDALQQRVESGDQRAFVERVMQRGHLSVTEHANFTFAVEGVSRALLAQLTRHRLASFSVQSQRYVSMAEGFDYVIPPAIEALGEDAKQEFIRQMETMQAWYCDWQEKLGGAGESANEDARFVLPNAAATRLVVTMNARELMHFFSLPATALSGKSAKWRGRCWHCANKPRLRCLSTRGLPAYPARARKERAPAGKPPR